MDVGYYVPAARTTLNHVFLCACLSARLAQPPSTSPSIPSLGIDGCDTPPGCGYPKIPATFGAVRGEVRRWLDLQASGLCSSSATANEKMKEGGVTPTAHAMAPVRQHPRSGGARQRCLLCVATATPQSRRGGVQQRRRWALPPLHRLKVFLSSNGHASSAVAWRRLKAFSQHGAWGRQAIPEEVDRVILPSPAPEIHLSVARCCCRQDPATSRGGPWR